MQSYPPPPFLNYRNSSTVLKLSNSQANLPKNRKFVTARPLHWIFALLSFSSALFLLFNKSSVLSGIAFFYDHYVEIKYIIGPGEVRLFSFLILLSAVLLILVGIIFLISRNRELWGKIRTAFLRDDWGQIQAGLLKPKNTFVLSSIFSVAIAALHSFQRFWNTEFFSAKMGYSNH